MKHIYLFLLLTLLSFNVSATACDAPVLDLWADLSWVAPTERENNDPIALDEIDSYKIYGSNTPGAYECSITVNDGTAIKRRVYLLENTPYYFVITTIDTEGRESRFSEQVFIPKQIKDAPPPEVIEPIKPPSSVDFTMPDGYKEAIDVPNTGGSL